MSVGSNAAANLATLVERCFPLSAFSTWFQVPSAQTTSLFGIGKSFSDVRFVTQAKKHARLSSIRARGCPWNRQSGSVIHGARLPDALRYLFAALAHTNVRADSLMRILDSSVRDHKREGWLALRGANVNTSHVFQRAANPLSCNLAPVI
jgi:hypothetical protein